MPTYRCRLVNPKRGDWTEVEWDGDPLLVANQFHATQSTLSHQVGHTIHDDRDGQRGVKVEFACVEIEGHGEVVSRLFHSHLYRRGGVPNRWPKTEQAVRELARKIGWAHDPMDLLGPWPGEEPA